MKKYSSQDITELSGRNTSPRIYSREEHNISRQDIDADALKIMYRLVRHNFKAYLVGGGVRDLLLSKRPKDFDIATDATPKQVKAIFRNCRVIGRRFKLCHIFFRDGKIIEVATFRDISEPVEADDIQENDRPQLARDNTYGTESTDAIRRDITINGLFYDVSNFSIIDYIGGMDDIKNRIVRVIGDPDLRFIEDPIRMIRVVRHAVRAGFTIEDSCRASIIRNSALIAQGSTMRLFEEMKKDLSSGYTLGILRLLEETGLLGHILPELSGDYAITLNDNHHFSRSLKTFDYMLRDGEQVSITAILALIALFSRIDTNANILQRFEGLVTLTNHLKSCFRVLAVPRREKEKIVDILSDFVVIARAELEESYPEALSRRGIDPDLLILLEGMGLKKRLEPLLENLSVEAYAHREHNRQPGRRRRNARSKKQGRNVGRIIRSTR